MKINLKIFLSITLVCFLFSSINAQSKFEFGIGLGINHSKIDEDIKTQVGSAESSYKGNRLLSLNTRIGYKINNRIHLNSGLGVSWLGALRKDLSGRVISPTFELPVQLEWNLMKNLHFSTGIVYNYIFLIWGEDDQTTNDLLPVVNSRNQFGLRHGIAFSHQKLELSLSYSHYLTPLFNFNLTDMNGNGIGSLVSKFKNIQLGILFRV